MGDPMQFHRWALILAHRYYNPRGIQSRDDLYQIAMVGLLELWRTTPDASEALCAYAMRAAVVQEIKRSTAQKRRAAALVPVEEAWSVAGPDDPAGEAVSAIQSEWLLEVIEELPDKEFGYLLLAMMGTSREDMAQANSVSRPTVQRYINRAREHVRRRMEASA